MVNAYFLMILTFYYKITIWANFYSIQLPPDIGFHNDPVLLVRGFHIWITGNFGGWVGTFMSKGFPKRARFLAMSGFSFWLSTQVNFGVDLIFGTLFFSHLEFFLFCFSFSNNSIKVWSNALILLFWLFSGRSCFISSLPLFCSASGNVSRTFEFTKKFLGRTEALKFCLADRNSVFPIRGKPFKISSF